MDAVFKPGVRERLEGGGRVVLELGCGPKKRVPEALGLDRHDFDSVDVLCDLDQGLPLPEASVDEIHSYHFLEHVADLEASLAEQQRVLKPGGRCVHVVPHFSNPYFYSDYTHRAAFGLYTFSYFASGASPLRRDVPVYYNAVDFQLEEVALHFLSPWKGRRPHKWLLQRLVNLSSWTQEFYEENLCFWFPAYEVRYVVRKR